MIKLFLSHLINFYQPEVCEDIFLRFLFFFCFVWTMNCFAFDIQICNPYGNYADLCHEIKSRYFSVCIFNWLNTLLRWWTHIHYNSVSLLPWIKWLHIFGHFPELSVSNTDSLSILTPITAYLNYSSFIIGLGFW